MSTAIPPIVYNTFELTGTVKDRNGALATPGAITFTTINPAGTMASYTSGQLTSTTTGIYTLDVECDLPGEWQCLIRATGSNSGADLVKWPVGEAPLADV